MRHQSRIAPSQYRDWGIARRCFYNLTLKSIHVSAFRHAEDISYSSCSIEVCTSTTHGITTQSVTKFIINFAQIIPAIRARFRNGQAAELFRGLIIRTSAYFMLKPGRYNILQITVSRTHG